jgi:hypothetical protein
LKVTMLSFSKLTVLSSSRMRLIGPWLRVLERACGRFHHPGSEPRMRKACLTDHPTHIRREVHEVKMVSVVGLSSGK